VAYRQVSQSKIANSGPHQLHNASAQGFDHAADLPVLSFHQNQFEK